MRTLKVLQQTLAHLLATIDNLSKLGKDWDNDNVGYTYPFNPQFLEWSKDVVRSFIAASSWGGLRPSFITVCPEDDSCISLFCGVDGRSVEVFMFAQDPDLTVFYVAPGENGDRQFTPQLFSGNVFSKEIDWLLNRVGTKV